MSKNTQIRHFKRSQIHLHNFNHKNSQQRLGVEVLRRRNYVERRDVSNGAARLEMIELSVGRSRGG